MRAVSIAALALALASCGGPALEWRGLSRDLAREVRVVREGGGAQLVVDGVAGDVWSEVAPEALRWTERGPVVPVREGAHWRVLSPGQIGPRFDAIADLRVAGEHVAYQGARGGTWQLVVDGEAVAGSTSPVRELVLDPSGAFAGVIAVPAERGGPAGERVMRDGGTSDVLPGGVRDVTLGAKGRLLAYVVASGERERLAIDHQLSEPVDEVLEVAIAIDAARWAALVAEADRTVLLVEGRRVGSAPLLSHLRISDDGAHVACLAPAEDGLSIDVLLDGAIVAHHRRAEGASLAFVPGTGTLVFLAEDAQGIRVHAGDRASERYERVDALALGPRRVGWIGRRGGRSEIVVDGVAVGEAEWAGELRLGRGGHDFAYVARERGERFVITRRGRWPVPRIFVDTLVLDAAGRHWAALVPDGGARRIDVWIDGAPRVRLEPAALEAALASEAGEPVAAVRAIVAAILARALGSS